VLLKKSTDILIYI